MNRRAFLTVPALAATIRLTNNAEVDAGPIVLHGNGDRDETDALQAWIDGAPVIWPNGASVGDHITMCAFRLTRELDLRSRPGRRGPESSITDCKFMLLP